MPAAEDMGKPQPAGAAGVKSACAGTVEDSMAGPQNMRETPCDSSMLLGIYTRKFRVHVLINSYPKRLMTAGTWALLNVHHLMDG